MQEDIDNKDNHCRVHPSTDGIFETTVAPGDSFYSVFVKLNPPEYIHSAINNYASWIRPEGLSDNRLGHRAGVGFRLK
jgi:hypothetical protein